MNYIKINKDSWNKRVDPHLESDFYNVEAFKKGACSLNSIELELLGDLRGKKVLHLQCHFGQDTMSMSRMGAKCVGVDFSDRAIEEAEKLQKELGLDSRFICSDLYELDASKLDEEFDIVFTSYGTIGWLPDINKWAKVVKQYLKVGGRFIIAEFHPTLWMFNDSFTEVTYSYFNKETIVEEEEGSYTDKSEHLRTKFVTWNHSLSEVYNALKKEDLKMLDFKEYDYSPYNCLENMVEIEKAKYMLKGQEGKFPMVYRMQWLNEL